MPTWKMKQYVCMYVCTLLLYLAWLKEGNHSSRLHEKIFTVVPISHPEKIKTAGPDVKATSSRPRFDVE